MEMYDMIDAIGSQVSASSAASMAIALGGIGLSESGDPGSGGLIQAEFDSPMGDDSELVLKELLATALTIAEEADILPEGTRDLVDSVDDIASCSDLAVTTIKLAYKVGTGELEPEEAMDTMIDNVAANVTSTLNTVVTVGLPIAADHVVDAVSAIFPPVQLVKPLVHKVAKQATPKVCRFIPTGVKYVADAAKPIVRKAVSKVKNVFSKLFA